MPIDITPNSPLNTSILRGRAALAPPALREPGGKTSPLDGKVQPEPERPAAPLQLDLSRVVEALDRYMRETSRSLVFNYDEASRRMVITVMDAETGEVVRQIPPDELLNLARRVAETLSPPRLLDTRA